MGNRMGFILDLDGTLYRGHERLPYAVEFIVNLRKLHIPFLLATNNSARSPKQVIEHMKSIGIDVEEHEIITSSLVTALYMKKQYDAKRIYVIGEEGLMKALQEEGFELTNETDEIPECVVQGIDRSFTYDKLVKATQYIMAGAKFIMTNPDLRLPSEKGIMPAAGSIGAAIEAASGIKPVVMGKPSSIMMHYALSRLEISADQVWVVGDNLLTDIAFGVRNGSKTALVLTGVTSRQHVDELIAAGADMPDLICDDLRELCDELLLL